MQRARIRTGWKNKEREISVEEFANAVSAICWRISLNAAKNLHEQDFVYRTDEQRLGVIQAYLNFLIHCSDRLMHSQIKLEVRQIFITALAKDCYRHYRQNAMEILNSREAPKPFNEPKTEPFVDGFIESLNQTMGSLAQFRFEDEYPGYEMLRLLGSQVLEIMGNDQTNRWVIDQVMDIDGPEAYEIFLTSFNKLKRSSGY